MSNDIKMVVTGKVRLSYVNLLAPRAQKQGDRLKYSTTLLIPKADVATKERIDNGILAAMQEGVTSRWNGERPVQLSIPIYDGDGARPAGDSFSEECKGHWVMTAYSELKPQIVDLAMKEIVSSTEIYSGMYARVSIRFFPYLNSGKKGIGCSLGNVQKLEDGEPLGGRTTAADDFGGGFGMAPVQASVPVQQQVQQPRFSPQQLLYNPQEPAYVPVKPQQPVYQKPTYQQTEYQQPIAQSIYPGQNLDPITGVPFTGGSMGK